MPVSGLVTVVAPLYPEPGHAFALTACPFERVIVFVPAASPEPPSVAGVVVIGTESTLTVAGTEITPPLGALLSSVSVKVVSLWLLPATSVPCAGIVGAPVPVVQEMAV